MKTFRIFTAAWVAALAVSCGPQRSGEALLEARIDSLLSQMTLEEKIGQMNQLSVGGPLDEMKQAVREGRVGSFFNGIDPATVNELQRTAVEESRLGIPLLMARDVIHGFATVFPIPLGQAATFDPEAVRLGARVAAVEAASRGIRWTFAPMVDISRDPRWGRIAESLGEDVFLAKTMAAAMVRGFQGERLSDATSVAACAKHYVGYGAAEGGRDYNSTFLTERQLRNVYMPPFEAAARAGAATFMTSFNDNDGVPASADRFALRTVLRGEWGFDGVVVSDWSAISEMVSHGYALDRRDAAAKALAAGVDMDMVSLCYARHGAELVEAGTIPVETVDEAVRNILRVKFRLGLFENPYVDTLAPSPLYAPEHLRAAYRAAVEGAVLLKNEAGVLPLDPSRVKRLLVTGPMADAPHDQLGTWVFDGDKSRTRTPLAAIREKYGRQMEIVYEPALGFSRDRNTSRIARAVAEARHADAVLAFVGEESILSGEAHSLAGLDLQGAQGELVEALAATGTPLVTVVMAGRPLTIGRQAQQSGALLYSFHPGTMGGDALADLIFGVVSPSGRTPVTFPLMVGQIPAHYSHNNTGRPANGRELLIDQIPLEAGQTSLGCESYYLDAGFGPLYPFGYGLTYTTFEYGEPHLSTSEPGVRDTLAITTTLTNTGSRTATEVMQLYVRDLVASVTRPVRELKGFRRVTLEPGQTAEVTLELPVSELAFWNAAMEYGVEPGRFRLWVAPDSSSGTPVEFEVK
ncbi:MAG: beta-glucosidase BglX [Rikenellaceae bacterium]|nr:beta-glucosidase BglX [Rikenellaceae bacterium]